MTINDYKAKLDKTLEFLKSELSQIRTGRATPALIENIQVDAYGSKMTLKELGSITSLDSQNLVVAPWDKGLLHIISKAIRESEAKLNPVDESDRIRVPVPSLTEERRKEFTKIVSARVEECKNSMRNVRQEGIKEVEKLFTEKKIGEDEKFKLKEDFDKIIKDYSQKSDDLGESKKTELMTI
jgi:ribosome recycling factor